MTQAVIDKLTELLANTHGLYLKTHNYHWNVTGPSFIVLHELLETHYGELLTAADEFAERIRQLGGYAPGSYAEFSKLLKIAEAKIDTDARQMLKELAEDNQKLAKLAKDAKQVAADNNDVVLDSMLDDRVAHHEKLAWIYASHNM